MMHAALKSFAANYLPFVRKTLLGMIAISIVLAAGFASIQPADAVPASMPPMKDFQMQCLSKTGNAKLSTVALDGMLSTRAIVCTVELVMFAKDKIVPAIAKFMQPIGLVVILLAFVLFGIRLVMAGGVRNFKGEGFALIFKAAVVILILTQMASTAQNNPFNLSQLAVKVQQELIEWTGGAFEATINFNNSAIMKECRRTQDIRELPQYNDPRRNHAVNASSLTQKVININGYSMDVSVWKQIDCMAGLVIGVTAGVMQDVSMFSMFLAMLSSGPLGIICFMGTLTFFITLLAMIARSVFLVMQAYIVIGVILMFLPLVIPTIMFRNTWDYFARFLSMYIGIIFQPIIMMIFLMFAANGIGIFLIGSDTEFKQTFGHAQKRSSVSTNPNEIYSIWQLLMFDRYLDTKDRMEILHNLVNADPGRPILSAKGMAAINFFAKHGKQINHLRQLASNPFMSKFLNVDGQEQAAPTFYQQGMEYWKNVGTVANEFDVKSVADMLQLLSKGGDDAFDGMNCDNQSGSSCIKPFMMPFLDLAPTGTYAKFLKERYQANKTKYSAMATEEIVRDSDGNIVYETDAQGNAIYEADGVTPKALREYFGAHPWYYGREIDSNFEQWYLRKLFTAIFGLLLMTYIFFSLNKDVPVIAQSITGSASYIIMGGQTGAFAGIPGGGMLQHMFDTDGGKEWQNRFKQLASKTDNPGNRLGAFFESGRESFMRNMSISQMKGGAEYGQDKHKMDGFLKNLENRVTGKEDDKS